MPYFYAKYSWFPSLKSAQFGVSAVAKHLQDEVAREAIENYSLELAIFFSKKDRCNGHFDEEQCIADAADELNYETEPFVSRLVDRVSLAKLEKKTKN